MKCCSWMSRNSFPHEFQNLYKIKTTHNKKKAMPRLWVRLQGMHDKMHKQHWTLGIRGSIIYYCIKRLQRGNSIKLVWNSTKASPLYDSLQLSLACFLPFDFSVWTHQHLQKIRTKKVTFFPSIFWRIYLYHSEAHNNHNQCYINVHVCVCEARCSNMSQLGH